MAKGSGTTKYVGSNTATASKGVLPQSPTSMALRGLTSSNGGGTISSFSSLKNGEKVNIDGIQFTHSVIPYDDGVPQHSYLEGRVVTDTGTYRVFMNSESNTKARISIQKVGYGDLWSQMNEVTISTSGMSTLRSKVMNAINEYSKTPQKKLSNPQKFFGSGGSSSSSSVSTKHITANSSSFFKK